MIIKNYTVYCDECARAEALLGQSIKDCTSEAMNKNWTTDKQRQWYCPFCSLKRAEDAVTPEEG